ncbi:MAG: GntR family transcriptional regulator [Cyclobacteriaceae bacterium]|jgi:GntR family transcriptional regulator
MKPKFIAISDEVIARIKSGELQPGDKIPSENELIKIYQVSNTTARKSLLEIELKGWARRIKGKGTFVLNRTPDHHLTRTLGSITDTRLGFDEKLKAEGFTPKNIILEKMILKDGISSEINGKHFIIEGPVVKIHQLRYADDTVMKDEVKYISLDLCPKIHVMPTEVSYFQIYENKYHLKITDVNQTLSADILQPADTENHFETSQPIAVFLLDSAVISQTGKTIEIERSYYRGDKYRFAILAHPDVNGMH